MCVCHLITENLYTKSEMRIRNELMEEWQGSVRQTFWLSFDGIASQAEHPFNLFPELLGGKTRPFNDRCFSSERAESTCFSFERLWWGLFQVTEYRRCQTSRLSKSAIESAIEIDSPADLWGELIEATTATGKKSAQQQHCFVIVVRLQWECSEKHTSIDYHWDRGIAHALQTLFQTVEHDARTMWTSSRHGRFSSHSLQLFSRSQDFFARDE